METEMALVERHTAQEMAPGQEVITLVAAAEMDMVVEQHTAQEMAVVAAMALEIDAEMAQVEAEKVQPDVMAKMVESLGNR